MSSVHLDSFVNLSSSLTTLSLFQCNLVGKFSENLFRLSNLKVLNFRGNGIELSFPESNWTTPLEFLYYSFSSSSSNELHDSFGNLKSLKYLDLSSSNFVGSVDSWIGNLTRLTLLDLSFNKLIGPIPLSLRNLGQLLELRLSGNDFTGVFPNVFESLANLRYLDISKNRFEGPISIPNHFNVLSNLTHFDVSSNKLSGTIPPRLFLLPSLLELILNNNKFSGHIPECDFKSLIYIDLSSNSLQGSMPPSIFQLVNLSFIDFSSNHLSGIVEFKLFLNAQSLRFLDLSFNGLSLSENNPHENYTMQSKITNLYLSSCNIEKFPEWLRFIKNVEVLFLSNNKINGQIPEWMWDVGRDSLFSLDLSYNFLTGKLQLPWKNLNHINVKSNFLEGSVPMPQLKTNFFSMSNNSFNGKITSSFCVASFLQILDLSHNNLSGEIPNCFWSFFRTLSVLNLQSNNFHGRIPTTTYSNRCALNNLNLNGNKLQGEIPKSILNCKELEVIDVGNNLIDGVFPFWLDTLPQLQILVLRSNNFSGFINNSNNDHPFPKLRIFDISNNNFFGRLPTKYIENFKGMMSLNKSDSDNESLYMKSDAKNYYFSVTLSIKGYDVQLEKILKIFSTIDLSRNNFYGKIPKIIGNLVYLKGLTLAHNNLIGSIPASMGKLYNLEWLNLSSNKLSGEIPVELTDITFLSVLDLSHNQLVGRIPEGKQFNTFSSSFEGNKGLCGFQVSKPCYNDVQHHQPPTNLEEENDETKYDFFESVWKIVVVGYGCGMLFGLTLGYLLFWKWKPQWFKTHVKCDQCRLNAKRAKNKNQRRGGSEN